MKIKANQSEQQAKRDIGDLEKWKELCRDLSLWRFLDELGRDLLLALRMLRKSPVFTAVSLVTLTLSIGANTAVFSLMNELILKSVPVPNSERLAIIRIQPDDSGYTFSFPMFQLLRQRSGEVMQTFAFTDRLFNLRNREGLEAVAGQFVSGQYFSALGLQPRMGRWIEPGDDRPGAPDGMVAVVSDQFWKNRMGSSNRVLGQKITLNQNVFTVIGVMPIGFRGMSRDRAPEVFLPLQLEPFVDSPFNLIGAGNRAWWLSVGSLLKHGVSLQEAKSFLRTNSRPFFDEAPPPNFGGQRGQINDLQLTAESGANGLSLLRLRFRKPLTVMMGVIAMVLLVACLNLATLLTARAASRRREISTRLALGATRARIVRQFLAESFLLALIGTAVGMAVAPKLATLVAVMLTWQLGSGRAALEVSPDFSVFAFTALLTVIATVLAGTLPAVHSTRRELSAAINESSSSIRGAERRYLWPRVLLALEVALSLTLVSGASLLGYSLVKLHQTPLGFEPRGLVYLAPEGKQPILDPHLMRAYKQAVEEIRQFPSVQEVSISAAVPINGTYIDEDMQTVGGSKHHFQENSIGPDYFKTLRTPLLIGREFRWADTDGSEREVVVNLSAARLLFPDDRILGRRVIFQDGKTHAEVVGVVADSKYANVVDVAPPIVYSDAVQSLIPGASLNIVLRIKGPVTPIIASARKIMKRIIPEVTSPVAMSMEETIAESLVTERIMSTLSLFFGGLALLMTGIGLYGTLAYSTQRRIGEIGIRMALGAQPRNIVSMVCVENGSVAALGCLAGLAGSVLASRSIADLLYGVSPHDPIVLGAATTALLCVSTAASLWPAIQAARTDPAKAIRYE